MSRLERWFEHLRYNLPQSFYQFTLVEWVVVAIAGYFLIRWVISWVI